MPVIIATAETSGRPWFGGWTWAPLQWVLGFERLGLESYWVDRQGAIDPIKGPHSIDYAMDRFGRMASDFGFQDRWCVDYNHGEQYFGMDSEQFERLVDDTELLINIGGHLLPDSPLMRIPRRAYVDVDPGYTQIWAHQTDIGLDRHNFFFTVGQNVGRPEFRIPVGQMNWEPILPPVVLDLWPARIDPRCQRFSTVADWRGSQCAIFQEEYYGTKREEFIRFLSVPQKAGVRIELALCIGQKDFEDIGLLDGHNWRLRDPYQYAGDPQSYWQFIQYSRAEFSVAKRGYVKSNSGWISDRTACYLASGKPALVQSTGMEWRLPTGTGLVTFCTPEEAVAGIASINQDYLAHADAARRIAEQHFDSYVVLNDLLARVGCTRPQALAACSRSS